MPDEQLQVSQAAREAAADFLHDPMVRAGAADNSCSLVKAFARFERDIRAEAFEQAATVAATTKIVFDPRRAFIENTRRSIATAIRQLSGDRESL